MTGGKLTSICGGGEPNLLPLPKVLKRGEERSLQKFLKWGGKGEVVGRLFPTPGKGVKSSKKGEKRRKNEVLLEPFARSPKKKTTRGGSLLSEAKKDS